MLHLTCTLVPGSCTCPGLATQIHMVPPKAELSDSEIIPSRYAVGVGLVTPSTVLITDVLGSILTWSRFIDTSSGAVSLPTFACCRDFKNLAGPSHAAAQIQMFDTAVVIPVQGHLHANQLKHAHKPKHLISWYRGACKFRGVLGAARTSSRMRFGYCT